MRSIRGHHLFCMTLFSGHGYDERFAENMGQLIRIFQAGEPFRLCAGQDAVCEACPNKIPSGGCALGSEDVLCRDEAVWEVLGFEPGQEVNWREAMEKIREVEEAGFQQVCGGCRWAKEGLCSYSLLKDRTAADSVRP